MSAGRFDWNGERIDSGEAMASVERRLKLGAPEGAQDWDLEAAGPQRFEDLLEAYERQAWTDDERYALAGLLLSSLDDRLYTDSPVAESDLERLVRLMARDAAVLAPRIGYWAMAGEALEDCFRVSGVARRIQAAAEAGSPDP